MVRLKPRGEREVELRQRVTMDDVFGDATEQPQRARTDHETDREMQSEVFAGREASRHKMPGALVTRAEISKPRMCRDSPSHARRERDNRFPSFPEPARCDDAQHREHDE